MSRGSLSKSNVLVVGFVDSVHVGKWLEANADAANFFVFPSGPNRRVDRRIRRLKRTQNVNYSKLETLISPVLALWEIVFGSKTPRALLLARRIKLTQPDLVHIFEAQHGGYAYAKALKFLKLPRPRGIITLFGSDLYWFRQFDKDRRRLNSLFSVTDYVHFECTRDIAFAKELGFKGEFLGPYPASGVVPQYPTSIETNVQRDLILAKGYSGLFGRGHEVLKAARLLNRQHCLEGLRVVFYSAGAWLQIKCWLYKALFHVPVRAFRKFSLTSDQMSALMLKSVIHVGASRSDGFPAAVLEALCFGALPVQSSSACLGDSPISPKDYVVINALSPHEIAKAMKIGLRTAGQRRPLQSLPKIWNDAFPEKVKEIYSASKENRSED